MEFFKGIHLDMKAQTLKFPVLRQVIEECAARGFNMVLLEYQDKFPYTGELAELSAPDALTVEQIEEIKALCRDKNMELVPLVQCLGHLEWVTRLEKYASLGEMYPRLKRSSPSLCSSDPESFALVKRITEPVLAMHKESKYFFIGGDEVDVSHECPLCGGKDKGTLLGEYYKKAVQWISGEEGKIPVMWADMVLAYDNIADYLPKETLLVDWEYCKGMTPAQQKRFYGDTEPVAEACDDPFAGAIRLKEKGFRVLTAPALRSWADSTFLPRNVHLDNSVAAFYTAKDHDMDGILVTSWAVRRNHWYLAEPMLCALAELFRDENATARDMERRYAEDAFHSGDTSLVWVQFELGKAVEKAWEAADFISATAIGINAQTGLYPVAHLMYQLNDKEFRGNAEVRDAYRAMAQAGEKAKEAILAAGTPTDAAKLILWSAEMAIFYGTYIAELCDNYKNEAWVSEMQARLDAFAPHIRQLNEYITDFTFTTDYHTHIENHKRFLDWALNE
ncbi:MAG: family 20 glycosylhydrolase [Clostridia bacterium]|nr:family 20 glycosylhydrolase [Clostridia bacterium]